MTTPIGVYIETIKGKKISFNAKYVSIDWNFDEQEEYEGDAEADCFTMGIKKRSK